MKPLWKHFYQYYQFAYIQNYIWSTCFQNYFVVTNVNYSTFYAIFFAERSNNRDKCSALILYNCLDFIECKYQDAYAYKCFKETKWKYEIWCKCKLLEATSFLPFNTWGKWGNRSTPYSYDFYADDKAVFYAREYLKK